MVSDRLNEAMMEGHVMTTPDTSETYSITEMREALDTSEDPLDILKEGVYAALNTVELAIAFRDSIEGPKRSKAWLDLLASLNMFSAA